MDGVIFYFASYDSVGGASLSCGAVVSCGPAAYIFEGIDYCCCVAEQVISDPKKTCRNRSGSHVPGKTSRHRPSTALKLSSAGSQLREAYALQVL